MRDKLIRRQSSAGRARAFLVSLPPFMLILPRSIFASKRERARCFIACLFLSLRPKYDSIAGERNVETVL